MPEAIRVFITCEGCGFRHVLARLRDDDVREVIHMVCHRCEERLTAVLEPAPAPRSPLGFQQTLTR